MISKLSRRDLLTTAPLAMAGTALAQTPTLAPIPELPSNLVASLYTQLGTVVAQAKAHTLTSTDLSKLHGMLSMVFPIWALDGTLTRLEGAYKPSTFVEPPDLRVNLSQALQGHGINLMPEDFAIFDQIGTIKANPDVLTTMEQVLEMQERMAKQTSFEARFLGIGRLRLAGCDYPFLPVALSAGFVAAIGWFNPIVVAVFGTIAAIALIGDYLFC